MVNWLTSIGTCCGSSDVGEAESCTCILMVYVAGNALTTLFPLLIRPDGLRVKGDTGKRSGTVGGGITATGFVGSGVTLQKVVPEPPLAVTVVLKPWPTMATATPAFAITAETVFWFWP